MTIRDSRKPGKQNMQRSDSEYTNFNTRVFWIAYFLSIAIFFAWIMR